MTRLTRTLLAASLLAVHTGVLHAAVSAEEAKQLGTTLTPIGAEMAGNKDGSIPAYTGGLTTLPPGFDSSKGVRPDPFANEKPLFSIDASNMDTYADRLSEGQKAILKKLPGFRMDVYPTHRSVAYPKAIIEGTAKNATRAKLGDDGYTPVGAGGGIPFPIPKSGVEVMINHITRYQGMSFVIPKYSAFNIDAAGKRVLSTQGIWTLESPFYDQANSDPIIYTRARANYTGPARRAGEAVMTFESVDAEKGRRAYQYLPGQRRVRLAPDLAYDTPNPSTSGMSTVDDVNLFNGRMDRYDWKLVGKKEMYVPYNTYRFTYAPDPDSVFGSKFVNPDFVRWELHRVWVVEATLKPGARHIYSRRTFYVDEDSWAVLSNDQYDGRGQLWRPGFAYLTTLYDAEAINTTTSGHYDLIAGTYYINIWPGTGGLKVADKMTSDSRWTPDSLAGAGVR
ncbi:DUF1329 domain-containing protein [Pseudomonas resinovorans]|uniref:DUF1329 domain-containing protein n=1 Tax=Metapseudomonas resinovorans TaxID=53412 RepID=A0ABT4Y3Q9_METRE|nr:DUF1329 domain-containing protein [Pseudomonas resinovorans]MDA8483411.1 DUF1329 domain-containing protein [Pseudomonas resinovorans]